MKIFEFFGEIGVNASSAEDGIRNIRDDAKRSAGGIGEAFTSMGSKIGGVFQQIGKIAGGIGLYKMVQTGVNLVTGSLDAAITRVDTLNNAGKVFDALGFSAEEAAYATDLFGTSLDGLPTGLDQAIKGTQSFAGVTNDLEGSADTWNAVNNAVLAFGGTAQQVDQVTDALTKSFASGTVDGQAFQSMIAGGLGPALQRMASMRGYESITELQQAFADGVLDADDFRESLVQLSEEGYEGMDSLSEMARAMTGGIATSFGLIRSRVAQGVASILESIDKLLSNVGLPGIAEILDKISVGARQALRNVATWIEGLAPTIKRFVGFLENIGDLINEVFGDNLTEVVEAFFGDLVQDGMEMWEFFSSLMKQVDWAGIYESIKGIVQDGLRFFSPLLTAINRIVQASTDRFKGLMTAIMQIFQGDWRRAWFNLQHIFVDSVRTIASALYNAFTEMFENVKDLISRVDWAQTGQTIMSALGFAIRRAVSTLGQIGTLLREWITNQLGLEEGASWRAIGGQIVELIRDGIGQARDAFSGVTSLIRGWIAERLNLEPGSGWLTIGSTILEKIKGGLSTAGGMVKGVVDSIIGWIKDQLDISGRGSQWGAIARKILDNIADGVEDAVASITTFVVNFIQGLNKSGPTPAEVQEFTGKVLQAIVNSMLFLMEAFTKIAAAITKGILTGLEAVDTSGWSPIGTAIFNGITEALSKVWEFDKSVAEMIEAFITAINGGGWDDLGTAIWNQLKSVFEGMWERLISNSFFGGQIEFTEQDAERYMRELDPEQRGGGGRGGSREESSSGGGLFSFLRPLSASAAESGGARHGGIGSTGGIGTPSFDTSGIDALLQKIRDLNLQINQAFEQVKSNIASNEVGLGNQFRTMFLNVGAGLTTHFQTFTTSLTQGFKTVFERVKSGIAENETGLQNQFRTLFLNLVARVSENINNLANDMNQDFRSLFETVKSGIADNEQGVINQFRTMFINVGAEISKNINQLANDITGWMQAVVTAFSSAVDGARQAGVDTGKGFYNGLSSQSGLIIGLAQSIANDVASTMRKALQTRSPSKVGFAILRDYGLGLYNGLESMRDSINKLAYDMINFDVPDYSFATASNVDIGGGQQREMVTMFSEMVDLLQGIRDKDSNTYLDRQRVSRELHDPMTELARMRDRLRSRQEGTWT